MADVSKDISPAQIIELVIRRRWLILIPFSLSVIAGICLAFLLPKTFEVSTLILVEAQRVPEDYVQSVVSLDFDARINTISQQILSRTNLEKIINNLGLYKDPKYENFFMEEKIEHMRKMISVDVTRHRGRSPDSFKISFKGDNPDEVVKVANSLASYFIDENLKVREAQAIGTSDFLEGELVSMRHKLEEVEEKMKDYRKHYMGELPEQLESNLRILDRIEEQLIESKQRLSEARNQLVSIENQVAATSSTGPETVSDTGEPSSIEQLKAELSNLKSKYTEKHPDIIRLKKMVAELEAERRKTQSAEGGAGRVAARPAISPGDAMRMREIRNDINLIENDIADLEEQKKMYKARVENTPKREQELMSLRRDYQNIQDSYDSLLNRKLESEIAVNMEKKQKGERFRVVDMAVKPEKPVEPDMKKMFVFSMAAGLGFGVGIILLLEYLDTSFRKIEDLESYLSLSVIATIPPIRHPKDILKRRAHTYLTVTYLFFSFILLCSFVLVVLKGPDEILILIKKLI